jgi:hypothetical protein
VRNRREHDAAEQHRERRDPQQLVAERRAGQQARRRGAAAERQGALQVAGAAAPQVRQLPQKPRPLRDLAQPRAFVGEPRFVRRPHHRQAAGIGTVRGGGHALAFATRWQACGGIGQADAVDARLMDGEL